MTFFDTDRVAYPYPLPAIKREWQEWKEGTARKLAERIRADKAWELLPMLADALEEAGCTDKQILEHLRGQAMATFRSRNPCGETAPLTHEKGAYPKQGGCWRGSCWVVDLVCGVEPEIIARFHYRGQTEPWRDWEEAPVINPGNDSEHVWLVSVACGYSSLPFIVEERCETDAWDTFAEDASYGHLVCIAEEDYGDYGYHVHPGDQIGGQTFDRECWVDMNGKEREEGDSLPEPTVSGGGVFYSTDDLYINDVHSLTDLRYFGPGLPLDGVTPENYTARQCDNCHFDFHVCSGTSGTTDLTSPWVQRFCSERCHLAYEHSGPSYPAKREGLGLDPLVARCCVCDRNVDPIVDPAASLAAHVTRNVDVGWHFNALAGGDYALPADGPEETYTDWQGREFRPCPGSNKPGRVCRRDDD
jgi:hypothetical protein